MDYYKLITERESIRNYDPNKQIDKAVIERIVNAGRLAPSAANKQPWEFIVVTSKDGLDKIKSCYHRDWFKDAPCILIVKGYRDRAWVRSFDGYNSLETDLTIAMDHIVLAAEFEGVGTCWIAAFDPKILYGALELTENEEVFAITPLGYQRQGFVKKGGKNRKEPGELIRWM